MPRRGTRLLLTAVLGAASVALPIATAAPPAAAAGSFTSAVQEAPAADTWSPWKACSATNTTDNCAQVRAMAQLGNVIYIGGDFTELRADGQAPITGLGGFAAIDATTHQPLTNIALPRFKNTSGVAVQTIAVDPGTGDPSTARIYVGGGFNYAAFGSDGYKIVYQRLVSFTPDGTLVAAYNPNLVVNALTVSGGTLYAGGSFTTLRTSPTDKTLVPVHDAAAIDLSTGAVDPTWAPTFAVTRATNPNDKGSIKTPAVTALAAAHGRIYVGGHFDKAGPTAAGGMSSHIMIVAVDPVTGTVDDSFAAVTNPIDYDQHYWSVMSIATVGNAGDPNAGVLAAAGGLTNRTYHFRLNGSTVWQFIADGDSQAVAVRGDDVYIGGHFQCIGPYSIPVQGSCTPPKPKDPQPGSTDCQNANPASMPTCFYDPNPAVVNRTHLAMVSYSQTVTTKHNGQTFVTPRALADPGTEPWNPRLNPIYAPYYFGVWTLHVFDGDLWVGGVWKAISVPTGPETPKDPDQETYATYDLAKLAVFPKVSTGPSLAASTVTVSSTPNPSTEGDPVTLTATVAAAAGADVPTGSVQFTADGADIGGPVPLTGGTATLVTSSLGAGSHLIGAVYGGDATFAGSNGTLAGGQTVQGVTPPPPPPPVSSTGPLSLSVGDTTVLEGNSGTTTAPFPVTLSADPGTGRQVAVTVRTSDGTAHAGSDYTAVATTLTWQQGDPLTKTLAVPVIGDTVPEGNETFHVTLSAPSNAALADPTATGTIVDEEGPIAFSVDDVAKVEGNSGTSPMAFTVTASPAPAPGQTVSVKVRTTPGSAKGGADFKGVGLHAITFTAAAPTQTVNVPIIGDRKQEPNETLFLVLSAPSAGTVIADKGGKGTIINDDGGLGATPPPAISVSDTTVVEPAGGTVGAVFTLSLPAPPTQPVSVKVSTANGTATAGSDYVALPTTTVSWAPGDPATKTVTVPVLGDTIGEPTETFSLKLSSPTGAVLGDASGVARIVDPQGPPTISIGDAWTVEGNAGQHPMQFPVTLSQPVAAGQRITIKYSTAHGTATGGQDFTGTSGRMITWLPGDPQTKLISIPIHGDTAVEPDETFKVNLSHVTGGATVADGQAIGTILNDD